MRLSPSSSDSHRSIALSTIYQPLLSTRAIGFSCSKHFAVLEILISRFSLPHSTAPPSSDGASGSPMVRCPRNLAIAFRLISRFVTKGCTENGGRLWYLCKHVGAMRGCDFCFICFSYSGPAPLLYVFKMGRVVILLFRI